MDFKQIDKMALDLGISYDNDKRIRSGIKYALIRATYNGHACVIKENLIEFVISLLDVMTENIEDGLIELRANDEIVIEERNDGTGTWIYLSNFYYTEQDIALRIKRLQSAPNVKQIKNIAVLLKKLETQSNIELSEKQKEAIELVNENNVTIITGGPGTGKTTIIKSIIDIYEQKGNKVVLCAPTGRAAKKMTETTGKEASTLHRLLEIGKIDENNFYQTSTEYEGAPIDADLIIVDELSMVDMFVMSYLLKCIYRGTKLILVGDKDQLPSVGAGNVLDDILKSGIISVSYLTKIFRQSENSLIVSNAHLINDGKMPVLDNSSSDFFFDQKTELQDIKNTIVEMVTKRIPKFKNLDVSKIQVLAPLKAGICGIESLNQNLQNILNPPSVMKVEIIIGSSVFREGDKVMQMSNNYDLRWIKKDGYYSEEGAGVFNGDIGYIHKIDRNTGETIIWFEDGRECVYPRTEIHQLSLAYAITIHKSQGSEFDVVVIPIISGTGLILNRNLIYTAVTRAKKMVVLVGEKSNLKRMISNAYTVQRFTMLKDFLINANEKAKELFG